MYKNNIWPNNVFLAIKALSFIYFYNLDLSNRKKFSFNNRMIKRDDLPYFFFYFFPIWVCLYSYPVQDMYRIEAAKFRVWRHQRKGTVMKYVGRRFAVGIMDHHQLHCIYDDNSIVLVRICCTFIQISN